MISGSAIAVEVTLPPGVEKLLPKAVGRVFLPAYLAWKISDYSYKKLFKWATAEDAERFRRASTALEGLAGQNVCREGFYFDDRRYVANFLRLKKDIETYLEGTITGSAGLTPAVEEYERLVNDVKTGRYCLPMASNPDGKKTIQEMNYDFCLECRRLGGNHMDKIVYWCRDHWKYYRVSGTSDCYDKVDIRVSQCYGDSPPCQKPDLPAHQAGGQGQGQGATGH